MGFNDDDMDSDEPSWRQNLIVVCSMALGVGLFVAVVYCCCRVMSDGDPASQNQSQAPAANLLNERFPRDSFYQPPPRYSALYRSQSQRRARLNALEKAADTDLPRYSTAVRQLSEQNLANGATPKDDEEIVEVERAAEVTETLLTASVSADNIPSTTDRVRPVMATRPLFHSADSLAAEVHFVEVEREFVPDTRQQMSASCGDLTDDPERFRGLLRKKVHRPDSNPPSYDEYLSKSQPRLDTLISPRR